MYQPLIYQVVFLLLIFLGVTTSQLLKNTVLTSKKEGEIRVICSFSDFNIEYAAKNFEIKLPIGGRPHLQLSTTLNLSK
jgi:hypothetical protein